MLGAWGTIPARLRLRRWFADNAGGLSVAGGQAEILGRVACAGGRGVGVQLGCGRCGLLGGAGADVGQGLFVVPVAGVAGDGQGRADGVMSGVVMLRVW